MEHNMRHMDYLNTVTEKDLLVLRDKEKTYQGSWKRSGGRSAWFMVRRMMDRLIVMLAQPPEPEGFAAAFRESSVVPLSRSQQAHLVKCHLSEDIFQAIEADTSGDDGTVLAVVRDLRRYLILIEAEIHSRKSGPILVDHVAKTAAAPSHATDPTGPGTRLSIEQNDSEYRALVLMHQILFSWDQGAAKWKMRPEYIANWARQ